MSWIDYLIFGIYMAGILCSAILYTAGSKLFPDNQQ
ncbi:hypothetical protein Ptc2401_01488 [Prosthecochloris sp. CIB 2401]|nr:hypothetical protein Ptc2401_01488 [Prosthecochloris sp. CIB 2401]